jgi:carbonic anhydrase/acetyltransferase-like protein (isoleucine patch superfamily)
MIFNTIYCGDTVKIHPSCFIAEGARLVGNVTVEEGASVWYNAVLRADFGEIVVGKNSSIQDCVVIHCEPNGRTEIGDGVTVGHNAVIHGALIHDNVLIGMHATILNDAEIGEGSVIGAHGLVTENMKVPPHSLVLGVPGKIVKNDLDQDDILRASAELYCELAQEHKSGKYELYRPEGC